MITGTTKSGTTVTGVLSALLLASVSTTASAAPRYSLAAPADFNCDGRTDISRRYTGPGTWRVDYAGGDLKRPNNITNANAIPSGAVLLARDYDGDCLADFGAKTIDGQWLIDFAADGLGAWNRELSGYGDATAAPLPADYDGDGRVDLSVKGPDGRWYIDHAGDGFGTWNAFYDGYGDGSVQPAPADYDGDGRADLSIKESDGTWFIDYASNGFGGWDKSYEGYGDGSVSLVPADYDGDGRADLSIVDSVGTWWIDFASDGFGAWNVMHEGYFGALRAELAPGDYDGDGRIDLAVKLDEKEFWYVDYAANGFGKWDLVDPLARPAQATIALSYRGRQRDSLAFDVMASRAKSASTAAATSMRLELYKEAVGGVLVGRRRVATDSAERVKFTGLQPATKYCLRVVAVNSEGNSRKSACFTTAF